MQGPLDSEFLLRWFLGPSSDTATNVDPFIVETTENVSVLMKRDFKVSELLNYDMCPSYPPRIFLLNVSDQVSEQDFVLASHARARTRFCVPVLCVGEKHLCRSATLSVSGEAALNSISSFLFGKKKAASSVSLPPSRENSMVGRNREADIKLLQKLKVKKGKRKRVWGKGFFFFCSLCR